MSLARIARPLVRTARTAPRAWSTPRRYASSKSSSSDMPWAIGSAVVFGGLATLIMSGGGSSVAHDVHHSIDAKASGEKATIPTSPNNPAAGATSEPEHKAESKPKPESEYKGDEKEDPSKKEAKSGDKEDKEDKEDGGESDEPSEEEIKASINLAEKSNAPKAAMADEQK